MKMCALDLGLWHRLYARKMVFDSCERRRRTENNEYVDIGSLRLPRWRRNSGVEVRGESGGGPLMNCTRAKIEDIG